MKRLLAPLLAIETLGPASQFLVVGPRTESDLLLLASLGFSLSRIRGLDLISYSPLIDLGDMHSMPYADSSFDVVICGWTLSYSNEPERAAQEMVRVCRPNGLIAVAVEYCDTPGELVSGGVPYVLEVKGRPRINSVRQLRELFSPAVETVYLEHDAPARRSHGPHGLVADPSSVLLAFSIAKPVT
jgi:SAM-dependent methyltransferase